MAVPRWLNWPHNPSTIHSLSMLKFQTSPLLSQPVNSQEATRKRKIHQKNHIWVIEDKAYLPNADAHLQDKNKSPENRIPPSAPVALQPSLQAISSYASTRTMSCGYPDGEVSNPPTVPIAPLAVGSNTISNLALLVEAILKDEKWKSYICTELAKDNGWEAWDMLDPEKVDAGTSVPKFKPEVPLPSADATREQEVMNTYKMANVTSVRVCTAPMSPVLHATEPGACSAPMSKAVHKSWFVKMFPRSIWHIRQQIKINGK